MRLDHTDIHNYNYVKADLIAHDRKLSFDTNTKMHQYSIEVHCQNEYVSIQWSASAGYFFSVSWRLVQAFYVGPSWSSGE